MEAGSDRIQISISVHILPNDSVIRIYYIEREIRGIITKLKDLWTGIIITVFHVVAGNVDFSGGRIRIVHVI